jgi:hypothetical protein
VRWLVVLFVVLPLHAAVNLDSFLVINVNDQFLQDPVIRGFFADVLRKGGLGYRNTETAAFLVLQPDGDYRCVTWPFTGAFGMQRFTGTIPDRSVAILHTHPNARPDPSHRDRETAMVTGVPVFILTRRDIFMIRANGTSTRVVRDHYWVDDARPVRTCTHR